MSYEPIEKRISKLPPHEQNEVIDFVDFLENRGKNKIKQNKTLELNWFGGLKEYKDKYTSLELQKKALEWIDYCISLIPTSSLKEF